VPVAVAVTIASLTHERAAAAGENYDGFIEIVNKSDNPAVIEVYQTDYEFQSDGSNSFGEPGALARSNAKWIDFSPNRITIPPRETYHVDYSVTVPDDASLSGTYWSMLMVEEINRDSGAGDPRDNQASISQVIRYGVQCITHIGESGESDLEITDAELLAAELESKELQLDVKNNGNRWAVPIIWAELYDHAGKSAGKFECEKKRIFPGTSVRFLINLGNQLSGKYKALVVIDSGEENVLGAKYDLEF